MGFIQCAFTLPVAWRPNHQMTFMNPQAAFSHVLRAWAVLFALSGLVSRAALLDDFTTKSGWKDFSLGAGESTVVNGQFRFQIPPVGQPIFFASTKTSPAYTLQDGRTIELRVDLVSGNGKDSFAILSWIPSSQSVAQLAGYSLAKSTTDILISKGINKYFYNENPTPAIKNENVTLVLSLTGSGTSVIINAKFLDKDNNNAVLFDKTFTDTAAADVLSDGKDDPAAAFLGSGNFVLMEYEDFDSGAPQEVYEVLFDNAQAEVRDEVIVDDFNTNTKTDWKDFTFGVGQSKVENGQFKFDVPPAGQPLFMASTKTSRTFEVADGQRLEFSVDLVTGNGKDSFAILSWIPTSQSVSQLAGYSIAKSTTDILITKGINKYFYNENPTPAIKNDNVTLVLSLTGSGTSVIINAKVLDKDNNNAVLFDKTFTDTAAADVLSDGKDDPAPAYLGSGNFVLMEYEDFDSGAPQEVYEVIFDNARASAPPLLDNTPPAWAEILPAEYASFLPASTAISFKVTDDKPIADDRVSVSVNGNVFSSTNGLTLGGSGNSRTGTLGGLQPNSNYSVRFQVVDSDGLTNVANLYFDTFQTNNFVIESEDYDFGGGQFIDNPVLIPESFGPQPNAYHGQIGVADVDYHDTRTAPNNYPYRPDDPVGTKRTLDVARAKFTSAGGSASEIYDYDVGEIAAGEYLNYTRTFAPGSYEIYLRESLFNAAQGEVVLEKVTGTAPNQTSTPVGSFLGFGSGSQYRNVPLTDALGRDKVVAKLSGKETLRLRQVTSEPSDGNIYQNYLIFIPAAETGVQRATVSGVTPSAGSTLESVTPLVTATIQNRDTGVKTNSIILRVNGEQVVPVINSSTNGATVSYAIHPLPSPGTLISAMVVFSDTEDVLQTNQWSFTLTYKALAAANRRSGPGSTPGFAVHVVQAPQGTEGLENSLQRAEDQLAANSSIPAFYSTNVVAQVINFSQNGPGSEDGYFPDDALIPGLEPDVNGTDDIAMEIRAYLDLAAGIHRFGVRCDDGYKLVAGKSLTDATTTPLAFHNGGPADETVDFVVPQAGLYPFRMVWYERGGGAFVEWFSVDPTSGERTLINDPNSANAVKAYVSAPDLPQLQVLSAVRITDAFVPEPSAAIDTTARTITIPMSGPVRFYLLQNGGIDPQNVKVRVAGLNLVISY